MNIDITDVENVLNSLPYMDKKLRRFMFNALSNNLSFISGTMPPAESTIDENNYKLEDLDKAFYYFKNNNVSNLVVQPKYMGSRCQVVFEKVDGKLEIKAFSRNGYQIKLVDKDLNDNLIKKACLDWLEKYKILFKKELIIDCELLPWSILGKDLIDENYKSYYSLIKNEHDKVKLSNLNKYKYVKNLYPLEQLSDSLSVFIKQVDIYGKETEPYLKAFNILKLDGEVEPFNNYESFKLINDDNILFLDIKNFEDYKCLSDLHKYFDSLVSNLHEGVVIKPFIKNESYLPYMKVRNEEYLTLIYGYNYKHKYKTLCENKKTKYKRKQARVEYNLGLSILRETDLFKRAVLILKMLNQIDKSAELDPRL